MERRSAIERTGGIGPDDFPELARQLGVVGELRGPDLDRGLRSNRAHLADEPGIERSAARAAVEESSRAANAGAPFVGKRQQSLAGKKGELTAAGEDEDDAGVG